MIVVGSRCIGLDVGSILSIRAALRLSCEAVSPIKPKCLNRQELLALHPTVKPLALIVDAIKDCSRKNGLILDCFAGSETILIAAERTGRRAAAIELDPHYVDTAIRRWQTDTGGKAMLVDDDRSFDELEQEDR